MNDIPRRGALSLEQAVEQSTKAPNSPPNGAADLTNDLELRVEQAQSDTERDRVEPIATEISNQPSPIRPHHAQ
jgi:hypothetical protein